MLQLDFLSLKKMTPSKKPFETLCAWNGFLEVTGPSVQAQKFNPSLKSPQQNPASCPKVALLPA